MTNHKIYIAGMGIISPLGRGPGATEQALRDNVSAISPLRLFSVKNALPVGEVKENLENYSLPRTHALALEAAKQAMAKCAHPPEAIILGTTTGGILTTETEFKNNNKNPSAYRWHGLTTVAGEIARRHGCDGPVITVSTACSSGAAAIKIALEMLRKGEVKCILAGGADSLCHLTFFGFHSLQLVDPDGSRPLDKNRIGMSVAEGAALLLLTTEKTDHAVEIMGGGLSCDAYHPAAPHPQGRGALEAMTKAIEDAGIKPDDIGYVNLHGTGTPDNDLAEARALQALFADNPPPLSSIKGAMGHSLAAAGAVEALISALVVSRNLLPANTRCQQPDPELGLTPPASPINRHVSAVLSNSFGFGGNNAALVIAEADKFSGAPARGEKAPLTIIGRSCLSGAGDLEATMAGLYRGDSVAGTLSLDEISADLPARDVRRLKRLARMGLALATAAHKDSGRDKPPASVFMGTGWGALTETHNFLAQLAEDEQYPSPTDFVGSVHNGPAGQVAIMFKATGADITTSGGDYSFEQALMTADLLSENSDETIFLLGADEGHPEFSPLFDPSISPNTPLADGGGGFCLTRNSREKGITIFTSFFKQATGSRVINDLLETLGGPGAIITDYGLLMAGIPAAFRQTGQKQLERFIKHTGFNGPVIDYRQLTGEFASASALAAVMAVEFLARGELPGFPGVILDKKNALVLGLGEYITAMEISGR